MTRQQLHLSIFGPHVLGPDGFRFAPHNLGDYKVGVQADTSRIKPQVVAAAADSGTAAAKTFGQRWKETFTRDNIGKGLMQGLGFGVGMGAVGLAAQGVRMLTGAVTGSIDAAIKWESALAGVSKTLDTTGLSTVQAEQALADIGQGLRDMSEEIPLAKEELAGLAEAGGALGIARDDLLSFVRTSALLGTTTNLAAQDAATALGKINAVIPLAREEYSRFAATLVDLGNKGASTESEIVSMAQRMAGSAGLVKMTHDELLGWAAAMANVGEEAEAGGSSFQRFTLGINAMVANGSNKLGELAELAGMTKDAFADLWNTDASEAMRRVVNGLGDLEQNARQAKLASLGFTDIRITRAFLALTNNAQALNKALTVGEEAWNANSAAAIEAEKRYDTTESKLAKLNNQINNFATDAGGVLVDLGLFLGDVLNEIRRGIDGESAAIEDVRDQVRRLARERGLDEAAAVDAYEAEVKRIKLAGDTAAQMAAFESGLAMEYRQIQDALTNIGETSYLVTTGLDDMLARVQAMPDPTGAIADALAAVNSGMALSTDQAAALSDAIAQVRSDSIVILKDDLQALAQESGKPFIEVLLAATSLLGDFGVETGNSADFLRLLRTELGLVGPAADEAFEATKKALDFLLTSMFNEQATQTAVGQIERFGAGVGEAVRSFSLDSIEGLAEDIAAFVGDVFSFGGDARQGMSSAFRFIENNLGPGLKKAILSADDDVDAAMDEIRWVINHPKKWKEAIDDTEQQIKWLMRRRDQALRNGNPGLARYLEGQLGTFVGSWEQLTGVAWDQSLSVGENFRRGLLRKKKPVAEAGEDLGDAGVDPLKDLPADARTYGERTAEAFAAGLRAGVPATVGAARVVVTRTGEVFRAESPPKHPLNPMRDIGKWGQRTVEAYVDGMRAALPGVEGVLAGLGGGPLAGLTAPVSLLPSMSGGLAGVTGTSTSVMRHEHMISADGARALRDAGFDDAMVADLLAARADADTAYLTPRR